MSLLGENVIPQRGRRLAVIGTSLVQHNDLASTTKISHHSRGWLRWAHVLSNGIFYCPIWNDQTVYEGWEPSGVGGTTRGFRGLNAGVSGQTFANIEARKAYLTTLACDIIVIDDGTNDMTNFSATVIQAAREALADYYLSFGKIVIFLPILARGTSSWASGGTARKRANYINRMTREYCNKKRNCFLFDWNASWVDMTQATDTIMKSGYSDDDIHFVPKGAYFVGKAFAAFLATILPAAQPRVWSQDDKYDATDNPFGNLLANPFLAGTGGALGTGASGASGVADGMRVERNSGASTVLCEKETRSDGRGFYQKMTFTLSGSAVDVFYFRTGTANTAHNASAGEWMVASCKVDASAYPWRGITLLAQDQGTNGLSAYGMEPYPSFSTNTTNWQGDEAFSGTIETPPFQLVAGSTDIRWRLETRIDTTQAGSPVLKVGEVELRKVTSPLTILGAVN